MRYAIVLVISFVQITLGDIAPIFWGDSVNGFSVGLSVSNAPYAVGQPALVTIHVRNDETVPNSLAVAPLECFLSFIATDAGRQQLESKKADCDAPHVVGFPLLPGATRTDTVDLRDYLVLTNGGRFVVTAKRLLFWPTFAISGNAIIEIASTNKSSTAESNHVVRGNAAAPTTTTTNSRVGSGASMRTPDPVTPVSSSASTLSTPSSAESQDPEATGANATRRIAVGIVAILMALILVIIWRAKSRRKSGV